MWSSLWDLKRPLSNSGRVTDDKGNTSGTGNTCTISNTRKTRFTPNDQDIKQVDSFCIQNTTLILFLRRFLRWFCCYFYEFCCCCC